MNEKIEGFGALLLWVILIILSILSGVWAWNVAEPESFLGGVGFLILWVIFAKVLHMVIFGIGMAFFAARAKSAQIPYETKPNNEIQAMEVNADAGILQGIGKSRVFGQRTIPVINSRGEIISNDHRTLTLSYNNSSLGEIVFSETKLRDVERIYGKPEKAAEQGWFYRFYYTNGLTIITHKNNDRTIVGVKITTIFKPILSIDYDVWGIDKSIQPTKPKTFTFSEPTPQLVFCDYTPIIDTIPANVLKLYPTDYAAFVYANGSQCSLKLFVKKNKLLMEDLKLTPIESLEFSFIKHIIP